MAYLTLNWTSGDDEVLKQFNLLFYIKLSEVAGKDKTLEEIITEQHEELNGMEEQLKRQFQNSDGRVLLVLDGLDEYAMGTNTVIDNVINNRPNAAMCKTCVIITSGSEAQNLNLIAKQMNKVIVAKGFDEENVIQCVKNFFRSVGNEKEASSFLRNDILELLRVPIMLVMVYLSYQEHTEQSFPTSRTDVVREIINLILDRKKSRNLAEEEKTNIKIQGGEKAWAAAQKGTIVLQKVIHSPPKEMQHLVQEPPQPQFRVKRSFAGVVSPILSHISCISRLDLWLKIEETTHFYNFLPIWGR